MRGLLEYGALFAGGGSLFAVRHSLKDVFHLRFEMAYFRLLSADYIGQLFDGLFLKSKSALYIGYAIFNHSGSVLYPL